MKLLSLSSLCLASLSVLDVWSYPTSMTSSKCAQSWSGGAASFMSSGSFIDADTCTDVTLPSSYDSTDGNGFTVNVDAASGCRHVIKVCKVLSILHSLNFECHMLCCDSRMIRLTRDTIIGYNSSHPHLFVLSFSDHCK